MMRRFLWVPLMLLLLSGSVTAQSSFHFQEKEVRPGTRQHFMIPIITAQDTTCIPITVFNGIKDGKTLGITAGVHGYEYSPILAGQQLIKSIDPQKLTGVIILVQVAGMESFLGRSPFISPIDKKNLNRSFPGSANGTNTEKIAHFITEHIITRSDYFLDMHSGDAPEDLIHYSAYYSNKDMPETSSIGKEMAIAMGYDYMVNFNTNGKEYMRKDKNSLYCSAEAFKRGIPAADIECGGSGIVEPAAVNKIEKSVLNMLAYLKMQELPGKKKAAAVPATIEERIYIPSGHTGIFYALKKAGDRVTRGMKLGYITDFFGNTIKDIYAENDGLLMLIISTPAVNPQEDVAVIGKIN
ncbi:succinylglutamate desuccinylase/aspartoacylase family protein [Chitinophaga rhizophila]|uniref:Succinylglutamate desuccinylase/aspartoacylase family protein n=1 Tax=Chitinophaga rhizophila TaxID=2866212 RepID=A0ABS7GBG3_9BACT|nr:M14 family metallopeptidase [Chitinophaga rhizophila]MBW8684600.1 succinylglutamate desuccinylase/aspartoacylase family protein [Chitinophaga rhizophila]